MPDSSTTPCHPAPAPANKATAAADKSRKAGRPKHRASQGPDQTPRLAGGGLAAAEDVWSAVAPGGFGHVRLQRPV
jgi:hypothetical protein